MNQRGFSLSSEGTYTRKVIFGKQIIILKICTSDSLHSQDLLKTIELFSSEVRLSVQSATF